MKNTVLRRLLLGFALPITLLLFGLLIGRPQPAYSALHNFPSPKMPMSIS